ncbi:GDSL-type esterase/lipase family protein [Lentisphaera profundi]|uniref:GDSL-type esterase/lipase family protein n=1 Tax=Lentisphaera profundi TaxID=1658616 RepID=A0ABY7VMY3_9BACT|nr:GDSL-type esterase/lipase family protein [Lentisphaera profundi]WDE95207.1 GDSL-type esterase/lipase family protein [Lentisphaera profundi]
MKYSLLLYLCISLNLFAEFQVITAKGSPELVIEQNKKTTSFRSIDKQENANAVSYAWRNIDKNDGQGNTLCFEVKGDGSDFLASIFLGTNKFLLDAHEATFSLSSTHWKQVSINLNDFVQNQKPWSVKSMDGTNLSPQMDKISTIAFGRGFHYHRFNAPSYFFEIRNIKFNECTQDPKLALNKGIDKFAKKLKNHQLVKVLLLGDSITEMGAEQSHFFHAMNEVKAKASIVNAAIGGHSVRGGDLVLKRSLKKMPQPDLIVIMYGANDCKAMTATSGFNDRVFEQQLLKLIHKVNDLTQGKSEFLLINGVPRIDAETGVSQKSVEELTPAYKRIAEQYGLVLCDSMSSYLKLSREDQKKYYRDSVHQNQVGLQFMGQLISQKLK